MFGVYDSDGGEKCRSLNRSQTKEEQSLPLEFFFGIQHAVGSCKKEHGRAEPSSRSLFDEDRTPLLGHLTVKSFALLCARIHMLHHYLAFVGPCIFLG